MVSTLVRLGNLREVSWVSSLSEKESVMVSRSSAESSLMVALSAVRLPSIL